MGKALKTPNLVLLITGLNKGGAEMQVFLLAKEFRRRGWPVSVVSMIPPIFFVDDLRALGIEVYSLNMEPGRASLGSLLKARRLFCELMPDVVHSHMYHANIFARILRVISPIRFRLVSTAHNIDETEGSLIRYWLYRLTRSLSHINTNVSQIAFDFYKKRKLINNESGFFVPNGIEIKSSYPLSSTLRSRSAFGKNYLFKWLAAGRLVPAKDWPNLFQAVKLLKQRRSQFRVSIAGEGLLRSDLEKKIIELEIDDCVELLGLRDDLESLMVNSDAFVMSSAWEGMPMVLLEALALGMPIVATDVGGVSEIVGTASGGQLVSAGDAKALADAMEKVMALRLDQINSINEKARATASRFEIANVAEKWEEIYFAK